MQINKMIYHTIQRTDKLIFFFEDNIYLTESDIHVYLKEFSNANLNIYSTPNKFGISFAVHIHFWKSYFYSNEFSYCKII